MNKLTAAIGTLLALMLLVAACGGGDDEPELGEPGAPVLDASRSCSLEDAACYKAFAEQEALLRPTPAPRDPRVREVAIESPLFVAATTGKTDGVDYWMDITQYDDPTLVQKGDAGSVTLVFAEATTVSASSFRAPDPCFEQRGSEGRLSHLDHPCFDMNRTFSKSQVTFTDVRVLWGRINVEERKVFNWYTETSMGQDSIEGLLDAIKEQNY